MRTLAAVTLACMAILAAGSIAHASDQSPQDIVSQALEQVEWNPGRSWAYTQTGFEDETLLVSRFDPSKAEGERWALLSVDNRPPTLEEIEDFVDDKRYEQDLPDDDSDVPDMIWFDSLTLAGENRDSWTFSFQPILDGDEADFAEKMAGEIGVAKSDGSLQYLDIRNTRTIRPVFGVKIKTMHMRFEFAPAVENGPQVMREITAVVKGGAYLLVSFDENESTRFSDFEYVGDAIGEADSAALGVDGSR